MRVRLLALSLVLLGCGTDAPITPPVTQPPVHTVTVSASIYCLCTTLIKDIELLVDGVSIARQQSPQGYAGLIPIQGTKAFNTPGTRKVEILVRDQTISPTTFDIQGGISAKNIATNSEVFVLFPKTWSFSTGTKLAVSVDVP